MAEQLVRVQVDAAVIAVAVVEVPVDHQDLGLLQILQRLLAKLRAFVHRPSLQADESNVASSSFR